MALVIEGGISIGGNITITSENITPETDLVLFYDAGNSMSFNGTGSTFNTAFTGQLVNSGYYANVIVDLSILSGGAGNAGNLTGESGNTATWTSQGVASYWSFDAGSNQYIDSTWQASNVGASSAPTLNSPTYTILAVARPQDFNNGAIVGGDQNIFAFGPNGGLNDGPTLAAANGYGPPAVIDTTTQFETDTWYCVAVTYDAGDGTMKLYTNGNLVATATSVPSIDHPTGLYWGTLEGDLWFTGDLSVAMVWERAISADEISQFSTAFLSRYVTPAATSSAVFTTPYVGGPPATFTVPEGVTSISVVAVGAGGGGTTDGYSPPGTDSVMLRADNYVYANTTYTGTSNTIWIDGTANPNIANVTGDGTWIVGGSDIGYPASSVPGWDLVTSVNSGNVSNVVITINKSITTTAGDNFFFYQAVAAAEGGLEIDNYFYNQANLNPGGSNLPLGPGSSALALVTDGPYGNGGVVDWTAEYPVGGGGAGGYGIDGLAWNIDHAGSWIQNGNVDSGYHTLNFSNNNLTVTALVDIGTGAANQECQVLGTSTVALGNAKIMYSVVVNHASGIGYTGVGLSNYYENLQNYTGCSDNSIGYYDDGQVFINGTNVGNCAPFVTGNVVDIAVDLGLERVWFRADGGSWNNNGTADPAAGTGGLDISTVIAQGYPLTLAASPWYNDDTSGVDSISIATISYWSTPSGFTFIPGVASAGGTGGQGASYYAGNNTDGTGGAGAGGGGLYENTGAGGSGTSLYGRGLNGVAGSFAPYGSPDNSVSTASTGGSPLFSLDGNGGQATPWNGGRGGWPGGGGGSGLDYYMAGNGGALAYRNNYAVTPGQQFIISPGLGAQGQFGGGSGSNGAIRIVWPGDTRQFPSTNVGPDTVVVPTLDITAHDLPSGNPIGQITFNINSTGGSTILEAGVVWGLPGQATYSASTDICSGSSSTAQRKAVRDGDSCSNPFTTGLTGSQTINFDAYEFNNEEIQVRAYARNSAGVAYSATTLTWTPVICLAEGTLITLADGSTKAIENITMSDSIRVWDFDNGVTASATPLWIKHRESTVQYNLLKFSDGSELKTIGQHRIFNKEAGAFTYPMTSATPIGTTTIKVDGTEVTLTGKRVVYERVNYYNVVTAGGYMNLYANSILTSMRYNNIYPIADMRYVKDSRVLRNRAEFAGIADRWIDGLRLPEQTIDIKHIRKYVDRLEKNEAVAKLSLSSPSTKWTTGKLKV